MKPTHFLFILLLILSPILLKAQDVTTFLLEGKIGKASIVMELKINGTDVWGQYYYKRFKKSIPLEGKYIDDVTIELTYEHWDSQETFSLKEIDFESEYIYTGTWKNQDRQTPLPVRLKIITDISKIPVLNAYVKHAPLSNYDFSRLANIQLHQDSIQKLNTEFSITWLSDSISGFSSFRINKNNSATGIDSINYFLEELQFNELLSYLDCEGSEYTNTMERLYIRGHVLSFALSNSYECGGAHPDYGTAGFTFNMDTGKQMLLTDFLYFGKTEADYPSGDSYKLGDEIMGPNIVTLLTKLYPQEMRKPVDEDEPCDYSTADVWDYTSWFLTKEGLYLYPYFYRAARCCDGAEFSTIPYKTLVKYKNPKVAIPMKW